MEKAPDLICLFNRIILHNFAFLGNLFWGKSEDVTGNKGQNIKLLQYKSVPDNMLSSFY